MDSGIKIERESQASLDDFKETAKNPYDYVIMQIKPIDPDAPPPKGNRAPPEHVVITKKVMKGESAEEFGDACGDLPANFYAVHKYFESNPDECAVVLMYLQFTLPAQGLQEKLIAINWCPDSASMKLKMRYSSTFKTICQKAPKINGKVEAHDMDDVAYKTVVKQFMK